MANANAAYSFEAQPRAVAARTGKKYRAQNQYEEEAGGVPPGNIMYDPRVVRGSTFAARVMSQEQQQEEQRVQQQKQRNARRQRANNRAGRPELDEVPAVNGRKHIDVQTDDYLEELTDRPPEKDMETQTDPMQDRPPSPLFMPAKTGVDKETQIEAGDLFQFDTEVDPILEVLVGKTLEQAMDEVLEEEELENIRAHKARFEQQRNAELAEVQRLEAQAKRAKEEKERRVAEERQRVGEEEEVMEKVAARGFAKSFLNDLHQSVFDQLIETGHFYDPVAQEVEQQFLPWLHELVSTRLQKAQMANEVAVAVLQEIKKKIPAKMEEGKVRWDKEQAEAKAKADEAAATAAEEE